MCTHVQACITPVTSIYTLPPTLNNHVTLLSPQFSPEERFLQRITCTGKRGVVGWKEEPLLPVETGPLQRQYQQRPHLSLGLCSTLQPYLCLPRQRPQHLWCLLLLRLLLEHVLQRLQIRPEQDATEVPPHRRQSERGEESRAGWVHGWPPSHLPTSTLNSHAEVGLACHSTDGQKVCYTSRQCENRGLLATGPQSLTSYTTALKELL